MHDPQPKRSLKHIKVTVTMQEFMSGLQTERCDQAVNRSAHGVASLSQGPIVEGGRYGQLFSASFKHVEGQQFVANLREQSVIANAQQNFTENQVSKPEPLAG